MSAPRNHYESASRSVCAGSPTVRAAGILLLLLAASRASSIRAGARSNRMLKPDATDTWPTYNGDYSGKRYSTLDQINAGNVNQLTLAWIYRTHGQAIKATSLEVNGILYFTVPDNIYAIDARYGHPSGISSAKSPAITSAIAASRCTKIGSTSRHPTRICFA